MTQDLVVLEGSTVELTDAPPTALQGNFNQIQVRTLRDLVTTGMIDSEEKLHQLLASAQNVTAVALSNPATFTPFVAVSGTLRTDLRRFGSFLADTQVRGVTNRLEVDSFWRVARAIEPSQLATIDLDTPLANVRTVVSGSLINARIYQYLFRSITVEPHSNLVIAPTVRALTCHDLLIHRTGKIIVQGSGVVIKAHSIQGEQ